MLFFHPGSGKRSRLKRDSLSALFVIADRTEQEIDRGAGVTFTEMKTLYMSVFSEVRADTKGEAFHLNLSPPKFIAKLAEMSKLMDQNCMFA